MENLGLCEHLFISQCKNKSTYGVRKTLLGTLTFSHLVCGGSWGSIISFDHGVVCRLYRVVLERCVFMGWQNWEVCLSVREVCCRRLKRAKYSCGLCDWGHSRGLWAKTLHYKAQEIRPNQVHEHILCQKRTTQLTGFYADSWFVAQSLQRSFI